MMMSDRGRDRMKRRAAAAGTAVIGGAAAYLLVVRPWQLRWGATDEERDATLAGDDLIPNPDLTATRAITVHAAADQVWPWIAQLGQGRGGFYSYDALENLVGSTSTAPTASCLNGRTSRSGTRSTSTRR